jgi:hypothetical protein
LNLLEIFHFGQILEINACVKMILSFIHRGTLWLDLVVYIDTQIIAQIIGLLKETKDLITLFTNKVGEKALSKYMKDKFHTFKGKRGVDVKNISDDVV